MHYYCFMRCRPHLCAGELRHCRGNFGVHDVYLVQKISTNVVECS